MIKRKRTSKRDGGRWREQQRDAKEERRGEGR